MEYKKHRFEPTEYHTPRYIREHPYNLQNHLIKQYNFPLFFYRDEEGNGDVTGGFYEDRSHGWDGFYDKVDPVLRDKRWECMTEAELLLMCQRLFPEDNIVGFRLVRFTNVSNGYPCDRLDVFGKCDGTPEMEFGQNIVHNDCPEVGHKRNPHIMVRKKCTTKISQNAISDTQNENNDYCLSMLSPSECSSMLRRAEKRGKEIPETLRIALEKKAEEV